jgi:hypothetical protein
MTNGSTPPHPAFQLPLSEATSLSSDPTDVLSPSSPAGAPCSCFPTGTASRTPETVRSIVDVIVFLATIVYVPVMLRGGFGFAVIIGSLTVATATAIGIGTGVVPNLSKIPFRIMRTS